MMFVRFLSVAILIVGVYVTVSCTPKTASLSTGAAILPDTVYRVEAKPEKGFHSPYFLLLPPNVLEASKSEPITIGAFPNNSGWSDNSNARHENQAIRWMGRHKKEAELGNVVMLVSGFPRPRTPLIYTHALSRDVLEVNNARYSRLDLQLLAMIDDARDLLATSGVQSREKVVVVGFSASGMFASRFTAMHPERVMAAVIGAPGGWPLVPAAEYSGKELTYPVGVADLETLTGETFDKEGFCAVPKFYYIGSEDTNDCVQWEKCFSAKQAKVINSTFGSSPVARWDDLETIFISEGCEATFKLYDGMGHRPNMDVIEDLVLFLDQVREK